MIGCYSILPPTHTLPSSSLNSQVAVLREYHSELQWRIWDGVRISRGQPSREGRWGQWERKLLTEEMWWLGKRDDGR